MADKKENDKPEESQTQSSQKPSSGSKSSWSTDVSPILVFLLVIANYAYHLYSGFQINFVSFTLDAFTFFVFIFAGFGAALSLLPYILQAALPYVLTSIPGLANTFGDSYSTIVSYLLIAPWWFVFAILFELKRHPEANSVKWITVLTAALVLFFVSAPFLSTFSATKYSVNQDAINSVKTTITDTFQSWWNAGQLYFCTAKGTDETVCRQEIYPNEDSDFANKLTIDNSLNTAFTMDIPLDKFISDETTLSSSIITSYVSLDNELKTPTSVSFACALGGKGQGKITESTISLQSGEKISSKSVDCEVDNSRTSTLPFYFNATASSISSSGYRDFVILKKPDTGEINIESDPVLKEYINQKKQTLNPRVGKDDLIQRIAHVGIRKLNVVPTLIFPAKQGESIDFALYLKNNGNGLIGDVKGVHFTLPNDYGFDIDSCGLTGQRLQSLKNTLRTLRKGEITQTPVATCKLIAKGSDYKNSPEVRTISVSIDYDYTVSRKATVLIP